MSYGVTPFAVDLAQVGRWMGSGDESIIPTLKTRFAFRFDELDDWDDEAELTLEGALRDLLTGRRANPDYGHLYAYAFELLCWHGGEHLPNQHWSAMRGEWADTVDDALRTVGVDGNVLGIHSHIFYRGAPVNIPEPDDFPCMGYLLRAEIKPAIAALDAAPLVKLDRDVLYSIDELYGWLAACIPQQTDLVCFYY